MSGRRRTGGGASWTGTARYRYRVKSADDTTKFLFADTLADIRADLRDLEVGSTADVEVRARRGEDWWVRYGTMIPGDHGPRLRLAGVDAPLQ
jgi:hypothetical protein